MSILFLAHYPTGEEMREGMAQRVKSIDTEFENDKRQYLTLRIKGGYEVTNIDDKLKIINANILKHPFKIFRLLSEASHIYIQSIFNARFFVWFPIIKNKTILDLHGVVPEECEYNDRFFAYKFYSVVEKRLFKRLTHVVAVTNSMAEYYRKKYPKQTDIKYIVKPIYPTNSITIPNIQEQGIVKDKYQIKDTDKVVIYSGNTQKWQNIDLMIDCFSKMNDRSFVFLILTQNPDLIKEKVRHLIDKKYRIFIDSVAPESLSAYYAIANYGFMLRDDIIVNRVAAPTKMIEYLSYGIIPIVKCPYIGDWTNLGYEYVNYTDDLNLLDTKKSLKNKALANECLRLVQSVNIRDFINE